MITVQSIIGNRPIEIQDDWLVFNSPVALCGVLEWFGKYRHGIYYAAVNPNETTANEQIEKNLEFGAFLCEFVPPKVVRRWWKECSKENRSKASSWQDVEEEYLAIHGKKQIEKLPEKES